MTISKENINWIEYKKELQTAISNEQLWAKCKDKNTQYLHQGNVADLSLELQELDNGNYDFVLEKYDYDPEIFSPFLK